MRLASMISGHLKMKEDRDQMFSSIVSRTITKQLAVYTDIFFKPPGKPINAHALLFDILQFNAVDANPSKLMLEEPKFMISSSDQLSCCFFLRLHATHETVLRLLGPPNMFFRGDWLVIKDCMRW